MQQDTEVQHVAVTIADDSVTMLQVVTKKQRSGSDPGWEIEATDEVIEALIAKHQMTAKAWARVELADLPADRAHRYAWRLVNGRVVVDPRVAPPPIIIEDTATNFAPGQEREIYRRLAEHEKRVAATLAAHPPIAPASVDMAPMVEALAAIAEQQNKDRALNALRFEALTAKTDPAPSERKYPALAATLGLTAGSTFDEWAAAIADFEASGD